MPEDDVCQHDGSEQLLSNQQQQGQVHLFLLITRPHEGCRAYPLISWETWSSVPPITQLMTPISWAPFSPSANHPVELTFSKFTCEWKGGTVFFTLITAWPFSVLYIYSTRVYQYSQHINSLNSIKRTEFFKDLFLLYVHECFACEYVYASHVCLLSVEAKVLDLLELDLEMVVSPVWTLGIEARSSGRTTADLNQWTTSPASKRNFFKKG